MDKKKNDLPDFNELNDRVIAEPSASPSLVIKTNLDSENINKDNPYSTNNRSSEFKNFFKDWWVMDFTLGYLKEAIANYDNSSVGIRISKKLEKGQFNTERDFVLILDEDEVQFLNKVLPDEIKYAFNEQDFIRGNQLNEVYELLI